VDAFPEDVRRFILDHVHSVEELEVLLLVRAEPGRVWDAEAIRQALYTSAASAARRLTDLEAAGIVAPAEGRRGQYRYRPGPPEREALLARLADVYKERRVAVISLIHSKPADPLQAFVNAFDLRKGK
jgi:hypothetical protein